MIIMIHSQLDTVCGMCRMVQLFLMVKTVTRLSQFYLLKQDFNSNHNLTPSQKAEITELSQYWKNQEVSLNLHSSGKTKPQITE